MWQSSWIRLCKVRHARNLNWFCVKIILFSHYFEMWSLPSKFIVFLYYFLPCDEVLLGVCYHCLVFMDPVNGYSKSKLLVKQQVLLKSKIRFDCVSLVIFLSQFSILINLQLTCLCSVKATKPILLSIPPSDIFQN